MHEITGTYTNQWDQPTTTCACGWIGDTPAQWELHLVEMARLTAAAQQRAEAVKDAKKALAK